MDKYKHDHHFHLTEFIHNDFNELIISNTFRTFALSLISLFLPIYLYELGFSIIQIFWLEVCMLSASLILHYFIFRVISKWGIKKTLVFSYMATIIFYGILYNSQAIIDRGGGVYFLIFMGIVNVSFTTMYWVSRHLYFIKSTKKENSGKRFSVLTAVPLFIGIISPFVGGLLITKFSFQFSFLVSISLMILGSIVLFSTKEIEVTNDNRINCKKFIVGKNYKLNLMYFIDGVAIVGTGFIWPLMLYLLKITLVSMGLLYSFSHLIYSVLSIYVGRIVDKNGSSKILKISTVGHGLSVIFRAFSKTLVLITGFQSMGAFFGALWNISFKSTFYRDSHDDPINSIMNMEVYQHFGRISVFLLLLILSCFYSVLTSFVIVLVVVGTVTFSFSLLVTK